MDPVTAAELWLVIKPVKRIREALKRRKERRMAEQVVVELPDGSKVVRTEPIIKKRTSTKNAAALVIAPLASLAVVLPFYAEIDAFVQQVCASEEGPTRALIIIGATWLVTAVPSYITTRLTKSPAVPGAL